MNWRELPEGSPFGTREVIAGKDARTLARDILAMSQEDFAAAFKRSPMKRAKLRGLRPNAAVVLGNIGTKEVPVRQRALADLEAPDTVIQIGLPLRRPKKLRRSSAGRGW